MAEYSRLAKGHYTCSATGAAQAIILPFVPDAIELYNYTAAGTPAQYGIPFAYWDAQMGQNAAMYQIFNATPVLSSGNAAATVGGISTFSAGYPQLGAAIAISGITKASAAVVTCAGNHGLSTGNVVMFQGLAQSSSTGMQQLADIPFVITVTGATTFTIPFNTNQSNYTALSGSPSNANVRQVLYPYLYFPGVNYIAAITRGSTTVVDTMANHNLVVGQQVAFRIPAAFGTTQLNTPNSLGQPVYGIVSAVNSAVEVVVNISSSGFTAFNSNPTVAAALAGGFTWPQMVAVGDNNLGVVSSAYTPNYSASAPYNSIWAPAIGGAFQNNTSQGFIIGASSAGTGSLSGSTSDVVYWRALLHDLSN